MSATILLNFKKLQDYNIRQKKPKKILVLPKGHKLIKQGIPAQGHACKFWKIFENTDLDENENGNENDEKGVL